MSVSAPGRRRHHELLDHRVPGRNCWRRSKEWDFLLINDSEARLLSGEHNLKRAAQKILAMGPSTLVIKRGEYGAMLFRDDRTS